MFEGDNLMETLCERCWNIHCKENEKLRQSKVDVCIDMNEHPEHWEDDEPDVYADYGWY